MSWADKPLDGYQQFTLTTAVFPEALAIPYLGLGLGDEAGELLEKAVALSPSDSKFGKHNPDVLAMLDEGGDVMWYLSILLLKLGVRLSDVYLQAQAIRPTFSPTALGTAIEVSLACSAIQGRIKKSIRDNNLNNEAILHNSARVVRALDSIARAAGLNLFILLERNRAKLEDRLRRNAIKGEGDAR